MLNLLDIAESRHDDDVVRQVRLWLSERMYSIENWSQAPEAFATLNASRAAAAATFASIPREERAEWKNTDYIYCMSYD
jgi:hypothetical protein